MADRKIRITVGKVTADAVLSDSETASAVWKALPLSVAGQTWGDEIYFGIPVKAESEDPREVGEPGERDLARERGQRVWPRAGRSQGVQGGALRDHGPGGARLRRRMT